MARYCDMQVFSWYTANFADYAVLYDSLGGLILLMLWFNYNAIILLLEAEISSVVQRERPEGATTDTDDVAK